MDATIPHCARGHVRRLLGHCLWWTSVHATTTTLAVAPSAGRVEFVPVALFVGGRAAHGTATAAQFDRLLVAGQFVPRSPRHVWQWQYRAVGPTLYPVQISRTARYLFYCHSQETAHLFALVPSRDGPLVLLALVRDQVATGHFLCRHELCGAFEHVRLLLFNGHEMASQMVQSRHHYRLSNQSNGRGGGGNAGGLLLLPDRLGQDVSLFGCRKQYRRLCHVRQLSLLVSAVLLWAIRRAYLLQKAKVCLKTCFFLRHSLPAWLLDQAVVETKARLFVSM
jgi:hypothetical protein